MKHFEERNKTESVIKDVTCDCCGKSCKTDFGLEYLSLSSYWGFGSSMDLEHWHADLCEECVIEKLKFINFKKERYIP